ncbi:hypothetical protein Y017_05950 [Alcanivorax sp. 97CO-5]|nr:hypothetical protein Y017_05950 [Alcanivorax sp. 97CO-5]
MWCFKYIILRNDVNPLKYRPIRLVLYVYRAFTFFFYL